MIRLIYHVTFCCCLYVVNTQTDAELWEPPSANRVFRGDIDTLIYTSGEAWQPIPYYTTGLRVTWVFRIRACSNAAIILQNIPGKIDEESLEICIGCLAGQGASIRKVNDSASQIEVSGVTDVLSCTEWRQFWLNYRGDLVQLGRGPITDEQILLSYFDTTLYRINALAVTSYLNIAALWELPENSGDFLFVNTPGDNLFQSLWKVVETVSYFSLSVASCDQVDLLLAARQGITDTDSVVIRVGAPDLISLEKNQRTYISKNTESESSALVTALTPNILDCKEQREFHVTWDNKVVKFARGAVLGTRLGSGTINAKIVEATVSHPIRALSVTSVASANWMFNDNRESTTYIEQTGDANLGYNAIFNNTWMNVADRRFITFNARSCQPALLLLSPYEKPDDFAVFIAIGSEKDKRTGMRVLNTPIWNVELTGEAFVLCDHTREFWLSWEGDWVYLGRGHQYMVNEIIRMSKPTEDESSSRPLHYLGFGATATTQYRIVDRNGNTLTHRLSIGALNMRELWRRSESTQAIEFAVRSCGSIRLALAPATGVERFTKLFGITIGAQRNSMTQLTFRDDGTTLGDVLQMKRTPGVLDCGGERSFYLRWSDNRITLRNNTDYPLRLIDTLIDYQLVAPYSGRRVKAVGFNNGVWGAPPARDTPDIRFTQDMGDTIRYYTNGTYSYGAHNIFNKVLTIDWFRFKVKACSDIHIVLGDLHENMTRNADFVNFIELNIGRENKYHELRSTINGSVQIESIAPDLLSCFVPRAFWVGWRGNKVRVGTGSTFGENVFLEWSDENLLTISGASVASGTQNSVVPASWTFYENSANFISFVTLPADAALPYSQAWRTLVHRNRLVLRVRACSDARMRLTTELTRDRRGYEVALGALRNRVTYIRLLAAPNNLREVASVGVLSCSELRPFWVTWYEGHVMVGAGVNVGEGKLVDLQDVNLLPIRAASFASGNDVGAWFMSMIGDLDSQVPKPTPSNGPSGMQPGSIAGITIGVIAAVAILAGVVLILIKSGRLDMNSVRRTLANAGSSIRSPRQFLHTRFGQSET